MIIGGPKYKLGDMVKTTHDGLYHLSNSRPYKILGLGFNTVINEWGYILDADLLSDPHMSTYLCFGKEWLCKWNLAVTLLIRT